MAQTKSHGVLVSLEPDLVSIMDRYINEGDIKSRSSYLRGLMIEDLKQKGLLTDGQLIRITQG